MTGKARIIASRRNLARQSSASHFRKRDGISGHFDQPGICKPTHKCDQIAGDARWVGVIDVT